MTAFRPLHIVSLLIAAAAIAGPSWAVLSYDPAPHYRALAENACKCARLKPDKAGKESCWHDFDAVTGNRSANPWGSACFPLSETGVMLADGTEITMSWGIVDSNEEFCTRDEAISAEALYATIVPSNTANLSREEQHEIIDRGRAALEGLSRAYARGDRITLASAYGCVNGY